MNKLRSELVYTSTCLSSQCNIEQQQEHTLLWTQGIVKVIFMSNELDNREQIMSSTVSVLDMLKKEVPLQVEMFALLKASKENQSDRRRDIEKAIAHFEKKAKDTPDNEQVKATIERLKNELAVSTKGTQKPTDEDSETSFSKETLRKRLHVIFGAYLAYLKDKDTEGYAEALSIIETSIKESKRTLAKVKKNLGKTSKDDVSTVVKAVATRATEFFAPVDKITQSFFNPQKTNTFYDNLKVIVEVGKKGGKPVKTFVSINVDELQGVTLSNGVMVNPFNRAIHNVAVSLYAAGNKHITPRMIYEAMNGYQRKHKPPEQLYEAIMESMRKLIRTFIKIDATEEADKFGLDTLRLENYLLPAKITTVAMNGQEVEAFSFMDEPPLYTYASKKKQISRCDIGLLAADISTTPENVVIRDYLLERVTTFKSKKSKLLNVIRYDTLYDYLELTAPNDTALRDKKRDVRTKVHTILNAWETAGFIEGYEEEFENRVVAKVRVFVAEKTQNNPK